MTENEAIEIIENFPKWNLDDLWLAGDEMGELVEMVIKALEEIQKYRAIGTVEEIRSAVEKQTAKRPNYEGDGYADGHLVYDTWICPCCGKYYEVDYDNYDYCPNCGQKLDWSDKE